MQGKIIFIFFLIFFGIDSVCQCNQFLINELGKEPQRCRTSALQGTNGVVYASAAGGVEPYNFLWTNLETGQTSTNSTWGGLKVGDYFLTVTDQMGCYREAHVRLDSVNPIADFKFIGAELTSNYEGFLPLDLELINTSKNAEYVGGPWPVENYCWWKLHTSQVWDSTNFHKILNFSTIDTGSFEFCLAVQNQNGCVDTACKTVVALNPTIENEPIEMTVSSISGKVFIELRTNSIVKFSLYDLAGRIVYYAEFGLGIHSFDLPHGTYVYDVVNRNGNERIKSGKLIIL